MKTHKSGVTRNRWQRFADWLAGGPPDAQKIEEACKKPWYKRHAFSIFWIFLAYPGMIHPFLISRLNAVPENSEIQSVKLMIVATREGNPHFDMRSADGSVMTMEWPVELTFSGGERVGFWSREQRQALLGCKVDAKITKIRWQFMDRYRVWSLNCPDAGVSISFDQTSRYLIKHSRSLTFVVVGFLIGIFPLWMVFFLREKRGNI